MNLNQNQRTILKGWTLYPIAGGATAIFLFICRFIAWIDLPFFGPGPSGPVPVLIFGAAYFYFLWIYFSLNGTPDPGRFTKFARRSLWVVPLSILGGRFLGSGLGFCLWDSHIGAYGGLFTGFLLMRLFEEGEGQPKFEHIRGTRLFESGTGDAQSHNSVGLAAGSASTAAAAKSSEVIQWAGQIFPAVIASGNFLVIGAIGTGKTLMHRELMASVLRTTFRVIAYDVKRDLVSHLYAMGVPVDKIILLNPFDARSWAWDVARDLIEFHKTRDYARAFVPDRPGELQPFFTETARTLLAGIFEALILLAPLRWTFRHVVLLSTSPKLLRRLFASHPQTASLIERYFEPPDVLKNVLATLSNAIVPLKTVATIWEHVPAERKISLAEWVRNGTSVLVMGASFDQKETVVSINRAMFNCIVDRLLSGPEIPGENRTWFFIDELKEAQRLDALNRLLTNGRSKGVRTVLGFQDTEGLRAVYGDHEANEILGMCDNTSILRLNSSHTASWASERLGVEERYEYHFSSSTAQQRATNPDQTPTGQTLVSRPVAYPAELMDLPMPANGEVEGYHIIPRRPDGRRVERSRARHAFHSDSRGDDFHERQGIEEMLLAPWCEADEKLLGMKPDDEDAPQSTRTPARVDSKPPLTSVDRFTIDS